MKRITALVLAISLSASGAGANAGSGLAKEKDINAGLLVIAAADKIRRECSSIGGRLFRAQGYANNLKTMAKNRGYSKEEVDAYINDGREKARMRERRNAYFQTRGASNLDPESLCVLGRAEIASKSQIGQLLRAK